MRPPPGNDLILGAMPGRNASLGLSRTQRDKHLYICGSTGTGKSKFLENLIRQDIRNWSKSKCGMLILDPHGSLYDNIINWLAWTELDRPIIPIDLRQDDWVVSYNVLRQRQTADPAVLIDNLIEAIGYVWGQIGTDQTPLFEQWAANILGALYEKNLTLLESEYLVDRLEDSKRDQFGYDLSSQLTSAQYGLVGGSNPQRTVSYALDDAGNRSSVVDGGVTKNYVTNNLNQYTTGDSNTVTNDSSHAIQTYQGLIYGYINDRQLTSVSGNGNAYTLAYDALGRTVKRNLNGNETYYFYDGQNPILERGAVLASNVFGPGSDEILIRFMVGDVHYFYQDQLGSVTHVSSNSGQVVEKYRYDAFGTPTITDGAGNPLTSSVINNRFMFTGREYAPGSLGFYEYRARAYHPTLGRFMQPDPIGFGSGDGNLFRYCANSPINWTDPMGLAYDGVSGPYETPVYSEQAAGAGAFFSAIGNSPYTYGFAGLLYAVSPYASGAFAAVGGVLMGTGKALQDLAPSLPPTPPNWGKGKKNKSSVGRGGGGGGGGGGEGGGGGGNPIDFSDVGSDVPDGTVTVGDIIEGVDPGKVTVGDVEVVADGSHDHWWNKYR